MMVFRKDSWAVNLVGAVVCVLTLGVAGAALAQKADDPPPPLPTTTSPPAKKAPAKSDESKGVRRTIHAIELATSKKARFTGNITLRIKSGHTGPDLTYYWGGRCKGTKVTAQRLEMLMRAMKDGLSVEVPAFPIKYKKRVVMCMQSIRLIND